VNRSTFTPGRTDLPANAPLTVDGLGRDQQAYAAR
jgi:hypothetical protein